MKGSALYFSSRGILGNNHAMTKPISCERSRALGMIPPLRHDWNYVSCPGRLGGELTQQLLLPNSFLEKVGL